MKQSWILVALALASASVLFAGWMSSEASDAPEPAIVFAQPSGGPAEGMGAPEFLPRELAAREDTTLPAGSALGRVDLGAPSPSPGAAPPADAGTTILVSDSETGEPIERFGLRIWAGGDESVHYRDAPATIALKHVPQGALVVAAPLDGWRFSIRSPHYLPLSGVIAALSPVDRRVFLRLEREAVVLGRVMFDGKPVRQALVRVVVHRSQPSTPQSHSPNPASGVTVTDDEGHFELQGLHPGSARISIRGQPHLKLDQKLGEIGGAAQLDLGDLVLTQETAPGPGKSVNSGPMTLEFFP